MRKRIFVNRTAVGVNNSYGKALKPCMFVRVGEETDLREAFIVEVHGPSRMEWKEGEPYAHVWVETDAAVTLHNSDGTCTKVE